MDKELSELKKLVREMIRLDFIVPEDIPEMDLYVDQVTKFMDQHLKENLRNEADKTLTKTMINNYTKNKLLPPPEKKKYSREHIILLIYIFYMKNVISINDIRKLLTPMTEGDFETDDLFSIYETIFEMEKAQYFNTEASIVKSALLAEKKLPKEENEYLNRMAFIYMLGYDVFTKKRLIEKLIDELPCDMEEEKE